MKLQLVDWISAKWLWWIGLYLILGVLVPWIMVRSWAHQHGKVLRVSPRQLFQRGELGLLSLILVTSVIWDLQKSDYSFQTIALGSVVLAIGAIMASAVWIESYCRDSTGVSNDTQRAWQDARNLTFLVLSMSVVTEILLDRFANGVR